MPDAPATDDIAGIAAAEFRRRRANARRLIGEGRLAPDDADALMRPWAAIAVLCRADLAQCSAVLAAAMLEARQVIAFAPGKGQPVQHHIRVPEDHVRALFARDLCPPLVWGPALATARDAALARADNPERNARARDLCALARALDVPLTAASCARPANDRKAA